MRYHINSPPQMALGNPCLSAFHPHPLDVDLRDYPLYAHKVSG